MVLSATAIFLWPKNILEDGIRIAIARACRTGNAVETIFGETVREIGILIVVFAPLEATFSDVAVSAARIAAMFGVGLAAIIGGIILESRK